MPALVIVIDEYAELADDAPAALKHADSIARLGRAAAASMIAATQRPTQRPTQRLRRSRVGKRGLGQAGPG